MGNGTMGEHIGLNLTELGTDFLKATMPVDHRTKQPYGLLHGGASCVLAETLGSVASALVINPEKFICTGICTPIHLGASTHVWDIRIHDEKNRLICVSRLTVAVLKRTGQ